MTTILYVVVAVVAAGLLFLGVWKIGGAYLKYRGKRIITCPETKEPAAVEVAAGRAALRAATGEPVLRLRDCTRWPERRNCGQECLAQIEAAPEDCLVRTIVTRWYEEKSCAFCGKPLGAIDWMEHQPCVMAPDRKTLEWKDLASETLPRVLETHLPVCWNCHIAENFRREHPDLVVDRDFKH